jgi:RND family efflux transporter MFP subunit
MQPKLKTYGAHILVIAAVSTVSCTERQGVQAHAAVDKPVSVAAVRAEKRDLTHDLEVAAEFRPYQEVDLHAKVAGYLKSISVDVGDRVKQGQIIAVLEVPEYAEELAHATASEKRSELDVVRAESEVKRAEAAYEMRKLSYDRLLGVSKSRPNLIAQQEVDAAAAQWREAEAQVSTAKANLAAIRQQVEVSGATKARVRTMMSYLRITAPFSGTVTKRYADAGAMIQAGTASQTQTMPVIRLSQVDRLRLILPVPESAVTRVRIGSPIEVRVASLERVFQGRVSRFSGRLDVSTRTMETEVDIPNPTGAILPGMYGYASLNVDTRADTLAVPVQAISGHDSQPTVYVINRNQNLEERPVRMGLETPNFVEISSGVQEGELVVIGNRGGLKPGKKVEAKIIQASDVSEGH